MGNLQTQSTWRHDILLNIFFFNLIKKNLRLAAMINNKGKSVSFLRGRKRNANYDCIDTFFYEALKQ